MDVIKRINHAWKAVNPFRKNGGLGDQARTGEESLRGRNLLNSHRTPTIDRYRVMANDSSLGDVFERLVGSLCQLCDQLSMQRRRGLGGAIILCEQGTTSDGRLFLFMKPLSEHGWLLERSSAGWRMSRADKIVGQHLFLRSNEDPWEVATLWGDSRGELLVRVGSLRFGKDLLVLSEYERRLIESMTEVLTLGAKH
jgi:hypothetical protein